MSDIYVVTEGNIWGVVTIKGTLDEIIRHCADMSVHIDVVHKGKKNQSRVSMQTISGDHIFACVTTEHNPIYGILKNMSLLNEEDLLSTHPNFMFGRCIVPEHEYNEHMRTKISIHSKELYAIFNMPYWRAEVFHCIKYCELVDPEILSGRYFKNIRNLIEELAGEVDYCINEPILMPDGKWAGTYRKSTSKRSKVHHFKSADTFDEAMDLMGQEVLDNFGWRKHIRLMSLNSISQMRDSFKYLCGCELCKTAKTKDEYMRLEEILIREISKAV